MMMTMRLPKATASSHMEVMKDFMDSGACVKENSSPGMENMTSPAVMITYWGMSHSILTLFGCVTSMRRTDTSESLSVASRTYPPPCFNSNGPFAVWLLLTILMVYLKNSCIYFSVFLGGRNWISTLVSGEGFVVCLTIGDLCTQGYLVMVCVVVRFFLIFSMRWGVFLFLLSLPKSKKVQKFCFKSGLFFEIKLFFKGLKDNL